MNVAYPSRILSVCSGVAGLDVGIARAFPGARTVGYIEREAYPAVCLVTAMEEGSLDQAPIWLGDLGAFPANGWAGLVDTIAASIPCQGNSVAGKRAGLDDPRWLWPQTRRLLRLVRPRYFILENVPGLATVNLGRAIRTLLGDLDTLGYDAEWGCLSAAQVGATFNGDRLWLLAWRRDVAEADSYGQQRSAQPDCQSKEPELSRSGSDAHRRHQTLVAALGRQLQRLGESGVMASSCRTAEGEGDQRQRSRHTALRPGQGDDGQALGSAQSLRLEVRRGIGRGLREQQSAAHGTGDALVPGTATSARYGVQGGLRNVLVQPASDARPRLRVPGDRGVGDGPILPEWPPLPDDTDGWRAVLDRRPDLAPAQPAVRRVATVRSGDDRLDVRVPGACSCPRGKRIAVVGNAVCPDQCAAALRLLWCRAFGSGSEVTS